MAKSDYRGKFICRIDKVFWILPKPFFLWKANSPVFPLLCQLCRQQTLLTIAYPHLFAFFVRFKCFETFPLVIIISIQTFHTCITCWCAWIVILWWTFCAKCSLLSLRGWVGIIVCGWWHKKVSIDGLNLCWENYKNATKYFAPKLRKCACEFSK